MHEIVIHLIFFGYADSMTKTVCFGKPSQSFRELGTVSGMYTLWLTLHCLAIHNILPDESRQHVLVVDQRVSWPLRYHPSRRECEPWREYHPRLCKSSRPSSAPLGFPSTAPTTSSAPVSSKDAFITSAGLPCYWNLGLYDRVPLLYAPASFEEFQSYSIIFPPKAPFSYFAVPAFSKAVTASSKRRLRSRNLPYL